MNPALLLSVPGNVLIHHGVGCVQTLRSPAFRAAFCKESLLHPCNRLQSIIASSQSEEEMSL